MILDVFLYVVVVVFKDVLVYEEWIYKCQEVYCLKFVEDKVSFYYCKVDFLWLMSDWDFIV